MVLPVFWFDYVIEGGYLEMLFDVYGEVVGYFGWLGHYMFFKLRLILPTLEHGNEGEPWCVLAWLSIPRAGVGSGR
jgi:hypothetical protein